MNMLKQIGSPGAGLLVAVLALAGCQHNPVAHHGARQGGHQGTGLSMQLVMPGPPLLELVGSEAWPAGEMNVLNHRRNEALGADRLPLMASVSLSEVRVWDQQWILNGRSLDTYLRSTRSIQRQELP